MWLPYNMLGDMPCDYKQQIFCISLYPAYCRCSLGAGGQTCQCMLKDVYYTCMYIAIAFILLIGHQPELGIWSLAGLWLGWPIPGGRKEKKLRSCLHMALVVLFWARNGAKVLESHSWVTKHCFCACRAYLIGLCMHAFIFLKLMFFYYYYGEVFWTRLGTNSGNSGKSGQAWDKT